MEKEAVNEAMEAMNCDEEACFEDVPEEECFGEDPGEEMDLNDYLMPGQYNLVRYSVEGDVELHERLVFPFKPMDARITEAVSRYLLSMLALSYQRHPEEGEDVHEAGKLRMDATVTIGDKVLSTSNPFLFITTISDELREAEGFTVDCTLKGVVREFFSTAKDDDEEAEEAIYNLIRKDSAWTGAGMLDMLEKYKRGNRFEYKQVISYYDEGEYHCAKILNGKDVDLDAASAESMIDVAPEGGWDADTTDIMAQFDFEKHADIVEKLHELVRNTFEDYELENCTGLWEDGEQPGCICSNNWRCDSLREVQAYLDKVNEILLPIRDEVTAEVYGCWVAPDSFGYATCVWTDEGFKIKGLMF